MVLLPESPETSLPPYPTSPPPAPPVLSPKPQRCNFVDINTDKRPITGTWLLDTSLVVPSSLHGPSTLHHLHSGGPIHLSLSSRTHPIEAVVELVTGGDKARERARLRVNNYSGSIQLSIRNPNSQPVNIKCTTHSGSIIIAIPRSFRGPITLHGERQDISPDISNNSLRFYERDDEVKYWVGEWCNDGSSEWKGDELSASASAQGPVGLMYVDEEWKVPFNATDASQRDDDKSEPRAFTRMPLTWKGRVLLE